MKLLLRLGLLGGLMAVILLIASLFRRTGIGEIALILAVLALVLFVESARYILRQFLRGYRGPDRTRD